MLKIIFGLKFLIGHTFRGSKNVIKFVIVKKGENVNMYMFIVLILMITNFICFRLKMLEFSLIKNFLKVV